MDAQLHDALAAFGAISLDELNARAALQRRVDRKYLVPLATFVEVARELHGDHQILDIDGRRTSGYHSVYFDTPALQCFREHVGKHRPRFKARTRHYTETDVCHFEVKIRRSDEQTVKDQQAHDSHRRDELTEQARSFLDRVLRDGADRAAPDDLCHALTTAFRRVTIAAADAARLTCDLQVRLGDSDGRQAALRDDHLLLETKTPDGHSHADELLAQAGVGEVSLSKYRVGIVLLAGTGPERRVHDPDPPLGDRLGHYFNRC